MKDLFKYNAFDEYNEQLQEIIEKKGYAPEIEQMLRLAFPTMIEYYGHEYKDVMFKTLEEIDILSIQENETIYDIVKRYECPIAIEKPNDRAVGESELKKACGVHNISPMFEIINERPKFVGQKEFVAIKPSSNNISNLSTFVHELSHAFKANIDGIQYNDEEQVMTQRSGISSVSSKVFVEDEKVVLENVEEKNIGLEEGINTNDENNIINKILSLSKDDLPKECEDFFSSLTLQEGKKYESGGYVQETICAEELLSNFKLSKAIRKDQFLGANEIEGIYNSMSLDENNNWKNLNQKVDQSVKDTYDRYKYIFSNPDWLNENRDRVVSNLREIHSMLNGVNNGDKEVKQEVK